MAISHPKHITIYQEILNWHQQFGRHDLPWQANNDAYSIWVSEIMLQQTQVATVIPYYQRFMNRFTNIEALANAPIDEVLHLWTGLGYYARARNLHKAAKIIAQEYAGIFPKKLDEVMALPGIGKSTAGAILAFSEGQHHAILDGNVKRVLSRVYAIEGWAGHKKIENTLWQLAQTNTPKKNTNLYTQAIMDFGATFCGRNKPQCECCCLNKKCLAYQQNKVTALPTKKPKKNKPIKQTVFLIIQNKKGEILLEQRPPTGIWGGLWCFPQTDTVQEHYAIDDLTLIKKEQLTTFRHTFSHYHLDITPITFKIMKQSSQINENKQRIWYKRINSQAIGLAAPIKKIMQHI